MTVYPLSLSGLAESEAEQAVRGMLDRRTGPARLERVLVVDDTAALVEHEPLYQQIANSNRVSRLLCVAVGPPADRGRKLHHPHGLAGTQGYGVLWVGDPAGIDWRVSLVRIANGHSGGGDGLDQLVGLLLVDEIFDHVHQAYEDRGVDGNIASPGLRLAGTDDEAAVFTAALALAVGRLCDTGPGPDGPFPGLLPDAAGGAVLIEGRSPARYREEVEQAARGASRALENHAGVRGLVRRGDGGRQSHLLELRAALTDLRDLTARLLREANTGGELTDNQRQLLEANGIGFQNSTQAELPGFPLADDAARTGVLQTIAAVIRGGGTLPLVADRLVKTEREVKHRGSASYLPEVEKACPAALLDHLAAQAPRSSLRIADVAEARRALGINAAAQAAQALADLLTGVANREWSPYVASGGDLERARIALDGIRAALADQTEAGYEESGARGARLNRMADYLLPMLGDLVMRTVADEAATPSAGGQETYQAAYDRASLLHREWVERVQAEGVSAVPSFATSSHGLVSSDIEDDLAGIKEALLYPPEEEMWQLCAPEDLDVLDDTAPPFVIRFASRLNMGALKGTRGHEKIAWTKSGRYAGQLRLVPLRPWFIQESRVPVPPPSAAELP